jgi:hypothetical protein
MFRLSRQPAAKSEPAAKPAAAAAPPQKKVSKCVCNMPFCICPPDKVEAVEDKSESLSRFGRFGQAGAANSHCMALQCVLLRQQAPLPRAARLSLCMCDSMSAVP